MLVVIALGLKEHFVSALEEYNQTWFLDPWSQLILVKFQQAFGFHSALECNLTTHWSLVFSFFTQCLPKYIYCWRAGIILSFWPTISWSGLRKLVQPFQGLQNKNHWDDWDGLWIMRFYKRPLKMFTFFSTHRLLCKSRRCISLRARSRVYVNIMTSKKVQFQMISRGQETIA